MPTSALPWYLKAVLRVAIPAACLAALYLSIPGEIAMARTAGWSETYAYAMPVCVSVYALAAAAIAAYRRKMRLPGQVTALIGAAMALVLAMCAQSIAHLIQQNYMGTSAVLVVAVSCVPPIVVAHLMHMAETPSQQRTASEEMEDLQAIIERLRDELLESHGATAALLSTRIKGVANGYAGLSAVAEPLSQETGTLIEELEDLLKEAAAEPRKPRAAVSQEVIERAAESLRQQGQKVTGSALAKALGVGESTGYRYLKSLTA
ncbi:hypothetical protein [Streptomyces wuyuanensis]|uniref:hypothetical protein n=1 Tax=Streptomyces wuyuanensis TaxID=1196353 RepID=UPI003446E2EE